MGQIFLNLMFTIVVPLVFVSIASAVGSMANMKRLGKILGSTIFSFLATGAIAGVCVLVWVNLFSPLPEPISRWAPVKWAKCRV